MIYAVKTSVKTGPTIGAMDKRIIIRDFTIAANSYGEPQKTWSDTATVWAAVEYSNSGNEENYDNAVNLMIRSVIFTIRYREGITEKTQIVFNDEHHDVSHIEILGRNEFLRVKTEVKE